MVLRQINIIEVYNVVKMRNYVIPNGSNRKNHKCMIKLLFLSRFTRPGNQPNLCSIFLNLRLPISFILSFRMF